MVGKWKLSKGEFRPACGEQVIELLSDHAQKTRAHTQGKEVLPKEISGE